MSPPLHRILAAKSSSLSCPNWSYCRSRMNLDRGSRKGREGSREIGKVQVRALSRFAHRRIWMPLAGTAGRRIPVGQRRQPRMRSDDRWPGALLGQQSCGPTGRRHDGRSPGSRRPSPARRERRPTSRLGGEHACALLRSGNLRCWGSNAKGQLGIAGASGTMSPVNVIAAGGGIVSVATGGEHTCVLKSSGAVLCWGANSYGQLGNGSTVDSASPVLPVGLDHGVVGLASKDAHTCVVMADRTSAAGDTTCLARSAMGPPRTA